MVKNIVLIRTKKGSKYARKILNSVKWLNENKYPQYRFDTYNLTIEEFLEDIDRIKGLKPKDTVIHARCANPRTKWTIELRKLQNLGYKVVNSVDAIELTSNKLACSLHLQDKVNHPKSWEYNSNSAWKEVGDLLNKINKSLGSPDFIIAKPLTSLEQGANVRKVEIGFVDSVEDVQQVKKELDKVPGDKIVIQEYIPYTALHRVIVIGGKALPYTFIDRVEFHKPGDWKVSCCLNKTTMRLFEQENPDWELIVIAEETQRLVGGVINFIDIFEYKDINGDIRYTNAEINTACSLNIHERLAKLGGRKDWNIHSRIAKQLVKELGV